MKPLLNADGKVIRRPLGFVARQHEVDDSETGGQTSGPSRADYREVWRGFDGHWEQEPMA